MLSTKRMVEIFRTRGGSDEFLDPSGKLSSDTLAHIRSVAEGDPFLAKVSGSDWFALTPTHLLAEQCGVTAKVPFSDIRGVEIPKSELMNPQLKAQGGDLRIELGDGSKMSIRVQPGGPYLGIMNLLMYVARVAGPPSGRALTGKPTTSDRRPTMPS